MNRAWLLVFLLLLGPQVWADDIEIYLPQNAATNSKPSIMLVVDSLEISTKILAADLVMSLSAVNVSLVHFHQQQNNYQITPALDIDITNNKQWLVDYLTAIDPARLPSKSAALRSIEQYFQENYAHRCQQLFAVVLSDDNNVEYWDGQDMGEPVVLAASALKSKLAQEWRVGSSNVMASSMATASSFNPLQQADEIYYATFKPGLRYWQGNLKRYRLTADGVFDANGRLAIDPQTGYFREQSLSFWTPRRMVVDGADASLGGIASRLTHSRAIYSNFNGKNLTAKNNRVELQNPALTKEFLNLPNIDSETFEQVVRWLGGAHQSLEDTLHSQPVIVKYANNDAITKVIFMGTNSGYLHAFDADLDSPKEIFAFIPKELLATAAKYYFGSAEKLYGLDGPISIWHQDNNHNGVVDAGEKAYLYIAMRRGGNSYYALDISEPAKPKLLWQINGRQAATGASAGFEQLGQSWSKMKVVDVLWQSKLRKVAIFAGGYDTQEDHNIVRAEHRVGNAIFMVDAKTGRLLWSASGSEQADLTLAEMTSSIVGDVVTIDSQAQGYVDLLYVADIGGRIWRIDLNQGRGKNYATGGLIADLGRDDSTSHNVRFYASLDVFFSRAAGAARYVLAVGSGYRAHPLDTLARDHFFVIYDYSIQGPKTNYQPLSKTDLQRYVLAQQDSFQLPSSATTSSGFYLELANQEQGEKVLSQAQAINNVIHFASFLPITQTLANGCLAGIGENRQYSIDLLQQLVQHKKINVPGIAGKPQVMMTFKNKDLATSGRTAALSSAAASFLRLCISTACSDVALSKPLLERYFWREVK